MQTLKLITQNKEGTCKEIGSLANASTLELQQNTKKILFVVLSTVIYNK